MPVYANGDDEAHLAQVSVNLQIEIFYEVRQFWLAKINSTVNFYNEISKFPPSPV